MARGYNPAVLLPLAFPLLVAFFLLLLAVLVLVFELRILRYAYRKIGVPPRYMFVVMLLSLLGSLIDVPLFRMGGTIVAVNVGGALVPVLLSLYLFLRLPMRGRMLLGTAAVAVIVHALARILPGVGIAVPMFIPPLAAAVVGLALAFRRAPPVAYVSGSMGALIGADLWNLPQIAEIGVPVVSIGGAGTFDGVFLTGIIAGLLA
jgi:uncharacterized membrane protein